MLLVFIEENSAHYDIISASWSGLKRAGLCSAIL